MNFFSRLLGKRARTKPSYEKNNNTPAKLIDISLGKIQAPKSLDILHHEVSRLAYDNNLVTLASQEGKLQGAALKKVSHLLDSNSVQLQQVQSDFPELFHQLSIASFSQNKGEVERVLGELNDESTLVELCKLTPTSSVRLKILEKIHRYESLKSLEKSLKHRDKSCLKRIRAKLDVIRKKQAEEEQLEQKKAQLLQELNDHKERDINSDYQSTYDSLERKVKRLDLAPENTWAIEAQSLLDICKERIEKDTQASAKLTSKKEAQTPSEGADAEKFSDALSRKYCEHINRMLDPENRPELLLTMQKEHEDLASQCEVEYSASEKTQVLLGELKSLTEAVEGYLFLIKEDHEFKNALNVLVNEFQDANKILDSIRQINRAKSHITNNHAFKRFVGISHLCTLVKEKQTQLEEIEKNEQDENRKIVGLIRKAQFAVKNGRLKQAQGIKHNIIELIDSKKYLPAYLDRQWTQLQEDISNLSDWHTYAAMPKLQSLIEAMQALSESPESPELQATKIKRLQDEWKQVAKGSDGKHQELWEEFKRLADIAYQVCEKHYAELDKAREENTQKSQNLIEQLQLYVEQYDWDNAHWDDVENVLKSAKNEWRECKPIHKKQQAELQNAFNEKLKAIQAHLYEEYARNHAEKTRLINSLKALIEGKNLDNPEELSSAITLAINYQKQWKNIGRCQRNKDQALWRSFRELCDAVFQKRDAQRTQDRARTDKAIARAEAILSELNEMLNFDIADFKESYSRVDELSAQFQAISDIPEKMQNALARKLAHAREKLEARNQHIDEEKKRADWQALFDYKQKTLDVLSQANDTARNELLEEIQASHLNTKYTKALVDLLKNPDTPKREDGEHYYRLLCVKSEIFSDKPSPDEDKTLRMNFQVEHLQSNFGASKQSSQSLAKEWLQGPAIELEKYKTLAARFLQHCTDLN